MTEFFDILKELVATPTGMALALFIIGFISAFLGTFGSGIISAIAIGIMIMAGVSPHLALATYTVGALGSGVAVIGNFQRAGKVDWSYCKKLSILAIPGAILGTSIVLNISPGVLTKIIGVVMLGFISFLAINKDLGTLHRETSPRRKMVGYTLYVLACVWGGVLTMGAGVVFIYIYVVYFGLTILETKGTAIIPSMTGKLASLVIFLANGMFSLSYALAFTPGMMLGGWLGSKLVLRMGDKNLKLLLIPLMLVLGLYMLFKS